MRNKGAILNSDALDIQIVDLHTFKDPVGHQEAEQSSVEKHIPKHKCIEVLHPSYLEILGKLWHVDHILRLGDLYYHFYLYEAGLLVGLALVRIDLGILNELLVVIKGGLIPGQIVLHEPVCILVNQSIKDVIIVGCLGATHDATRLRAPLPKLELAPHLQLLCADLGTHSLWNVQIGRTYGLHLHVHIGACLVVERRQETGMD